MSVVMEQAAAWQVVGHEFVDSGYHTAIGDSMRRVCGLCGGFELAAIHDEKWTTPRGGFVRRNPTSSDEPKGRLSNVVAPEEGVPRDGTERYEL